MSYLDDPRVLFAAERTLLAWNRTSLALIGFGFLIERSGLVLADSFPSSANPLSPVITFWLGLAFIALGVFASIHSSRQYLAVLRTLGAQEIPRGYATKGGLIINSVVALLGAALSFALYAGRA